MKAKSFNLSELISELKKEKLLVSGEQVDFDEDVLVHHLAFDSRKVQTGGCFVAIRGTKSDGHLFFDQAVQNGARVIISERLPETDFSVSGNSLVLVNDSAKALSVAAQLYYAWPARKMKMIGVTGTNGKTTVTHLISDLLSSQNKKNVLIGTIHNRIGDETSETNMTTPDPIRLNDLLAEAVGSDCEYAVMEVSSHALKQGRVFGMDFELAVFTNLSRDHLDYHQTFEDYLSAKRILFQMLPESSNAIGNADDPHWEKVSKGTKASRHDIGTANGEYRFSDPILNSDSMTFRIGEDEISTELSGRFNAYNLAQTYVVGKILKFSTDQVLDYLRKAKGVKGRFEILKSRDGLQVVIDYAHTPDALENVLQTAREIVEVRGGKLAVVFGCGGDRDRGKRPTMGSIAKKHSDLVYLSSDNPRSEDPGDIISDVLDGISDKTNVEVIENRKSAIELAIEKAGPKDLVVVAGKGHENYQVLKNKTIDFDDKKISQAALALR